MENLNKNIKVEAEQEAHACGNTLLAVRLIVVPQDKEFTFKKLCPYCQGDLTYRANGWEEDENGLYIADSFDMDCSTEPDMEDEDDWNDWLNNHSEMPYVHQLPVDEAVKKHINSKYRFKL